MNDFVFDLRYAARMLSRNPGFTAVAIFALALGIGANTAIFSVVNAVLLRPLPFPSALRLVALGFQRRGAPDAVSYPDFRDYRSRNQSLEHVAVYHDATWTLTGPSRQATSLNMIVSSAELFPMLGVAPRMGRTFRKDEDDTVGASPMGVVLSYDAWQKQFNSDAAIIGTHITLRGKPYTVIGVMPAGFQFPIRGDAVDAWTTFAFSDDMLTDSGKKGMAEQRGARYLTAVGMLKNGVSLSRANADLAVTSAALARTYPDSDKYLTARVQLLLDSLVANTRPVLLLLLAAVGCVLLVACANVANLLLARASTRRREIAIRAALGAGRGRVVRQVLTESILLSLLGGVAGLFLGAWGNELLIRYSPGNDPRLAQSSLDARVFLFAFGVSILTGVVFGLAPAFRAAQCDPAESLKEGSRGTTEGIRANKARSALIISEVALALMLLACAGLLIRSMNRLNRVNPGFRAHNVLSVSLVLPEVRYNDAQIDQFLNRFETRLTQLPGVTSASDVVVLPLSGDDMETGFEIRGHAVSQSDRPMTRINVAAPLYFRTMGTPLIAGRDFSETDTVDSKEVVLVNDTFARKYFPKQNPLGKFIKPGFSKGDTAPFREIVGIVASVQQDRIGKPPEPEVFLPRSQFVNNDVEVVVHTAGDVNALIPAVRTTLRAMDADLPLRGALTMEERAGRSVAQPLFQSFLFAIFAAVALILTAVGLYGVISYSVAQRTHEIGTRMALGAKQRNILALVGGQGLVLTLSGIVIGMAGALAISRLLGNLLYEIAPTDPLTLFAVAAIIFFVAFLATLIPARRAANVDPMTALRYE